MIFTDSRVALTVTYKLVTIYSVTSRVSALWGFATEFVNQTAATNGNVKRNENGCINGNVNVNDSGNVNVYVNGNDSGNVNCNFNGHANGYVNDYVNGYVNGYVMISLVKGRKE